MKVKCILIFLSFLASMASQMLGATPSSENKLSHPQRSERKDFFRESSITPEELNKRNKALSVSDNKAKVEKSILKSADNTNIYAWNAYSNVEGNRYGLYRLKGMEGIEKVWEDAFFYEISGIGPDNGYLKDGKIVAMAVDKFGNTIFEMQRIVYDFETGEVESNKDITEETYFDRMTYDPTHNVVYATIKKKGKNEPATWVMCEEDDWNNYQTLATFETGLSSLCYNVPEGACYAIDLNKDFIRIEADGTRTIISHLDFDFEPGYFSGLVYSPSQNIYYASPQTEEESFLMTITPMGEWNVYCKLPGNNQLNFMLTPDFGEVDEEAPMRPVIENVSFSPAEFYGIITYTLPTKLVNGTEIDGKLELVVCVDGEEYTWFSGYNPGNEVEAEFDDLDSGEHFISAYVVYNEHKSQQAVYSQFIGFDTPLPPTDVVLTENSVTWSPVDMGIHGEPINQESVIYSVYINGTKYGATKDTSLAIQLPDEELTMYTASVYAEANGMKSGAGVSNEVLSGHALNLPMHIIPTPAQAMMCKYLDNNEDGNSWYYNGYYEAFWCEYCDPDEENDDWLVMPPFMVDEDTHRCKLSFLVANFNTAYPEEKLEVYLGTIDENDNYIDEQEILAPFTPETFLVDGYQEVEVEFDIPASGSNYIGFHWISEPDMAGIEIKDIRVEAATPNGIDPIESIAGVSGTVKGINVNGHAGKQISIASPYGMVIVAGTVESSSMHYPLASGIYIVNIDGKSSKVVVK